MQIKKLSEIIDISEDLINSFEKESVTFINIVKSEILSNPKLYELIGNNSIKFLEDVIYNHIKIMSTALKFDSVYILMKGLSRLYRFSQKKGVQDKLFTILHIALENSITSTIQKYKEDFKTLYAWIIQNFNLVLSSVDSTQGQYKYFENNIEFITNFISKLFENDLIEAEVLINSYLFDDLRREKFYNYMLYPSLEIIKKLYERDIFDETETKLALSAFNRVLSSIYIEKDIKNKKEFYSLYLPEEDILDSKILSLYNAIEAQIFSDLLSFKGFRSFCLNVKEIAKFNLNNQENAVIIFGLSPYNFPQFIQTWEMIKAKAPKIRIFISDENWEDFYRINKYGELFSHPKEILEVLKND
ncbi:hypothetical protein QI155_06635 [Thermodesulfovibrio sp. 1176]|uniref:hypothetical protein n=2 Tax=unclassified Thermodesulfovibrio TaxID=2645936 RepID=UPI0024827549|nr:hypothetical protein [Thermodesulfovibrio sp. 1176]MDI1472210.1 hypothetical protein [Thermodesulfovibrio sp. 1176]